MENQKTFQLTLCKDDETPVLDVCLSWTDPNVSRLCVAVFQSTYSLRQILVIDNLETGNLTYTNEDHSSNMKINVYGLAAFSLRGIIYHRTDRSKSYQVLCSATVGSFSSGTSTLKLERSNTTSTSLVSAMKALTSITCTTRYTVEKCRVQPKEGAFNTSHALTVLKHEDKEYFIFSQQSMHGVDIALPQTPRQTLLGNVIELDKIIQISPWSVGYITLRSSQNFKVNTAMTEADLENLKRKAEQFLLMNPPSPATYEVKVLFREKSVEYFEDITENHNGIMKVYIKDNNGDPHCPINNRINGLFFSASMDKLYLGQLPSIHFFGPRRLVVPIEELFSEDTNLYFTDFYCKPRSPHYVTLVLTKKGSDTDAFCQEQILQLNPFDNRFLYKDPQDTGNKVYTTRAVHVEVLYTEDVDIQELKERLGDRLKISDSSNVYGQGHSSPDGIPKTRGCGICNL